MKGKNIFYSKKTQEINESYVKSKPVVFLSHKSEDKDFVEKVGDYLMEMGLDIYLDKNDFELQKATNFNDPNSVTRCIQNGISKSDYILCFVSERTKQSWWVPYEIGYGQKSDKPVCCLVKKDIDDLPEFLRITDIIKSKKQIDKYIRNIANDHCVVLNESYQEELNAASLYHPLSEYLL